jgi:hypothetical protein
MLFLAPPPFNCKSISIVVKAQNGSSGRLPDWLDCWARCRAPWRGGRLSASVKDTWLPIRADVAVVGPATQASPSNVPVMLTMTIARPPPPRGQDDARMPLAIASTWRAVIAPTSLAPLPVSVCHPVPVLCCALIPRPPLPWPSCPCRPCRPCHPHRPRRPHCPCCT